MNENKMKLWENRRKKGKEKYIWIRWVLGYSLLASALITLLQYFNYKDDPLFFNWVVIRLVSFAVIFIIIGAMVYEKNETKYEEYLLKNK